MPATFNATDFEEAAVDAVVNQEDTALARLAMDRAQAMRLAGDTSTKPTPVTPLSEIPPEEFEDLAAYCAKNGDLELAQKIRARAARLRSQGGND